MYKFDGVFSSQKVRGSVLHFQKVRGTGPPSTLKLRLWKNP